jgi:integrase
MIGGKARSMGLGPEGVVTLAGARAAHLEARNLLAKGIDPLDARRAAKAPKPSPPASTHPFGEVADAYMDAQEAGWRSPVHRQQWRSTLGTYAAPLADMPVAEITVNDVLAMLTPIWTKKPETASRVRGRVEMVLSYAKARGWRSGENPAAWRDNLALLLPRKSKVRPVVHHAALPWAECPAFMQELRRRDSGMGSRALQFAILTAARSGEVRGAEWSEIDFKARLWTVPASRMKASKEHRVPLSEAALAVLKPLAELKQSSVIFPGQNGQEPLSNMTLTAGLKRMGRADLTAHGFRSSFRDWAAEATAHPSEVVEMALAHAVGDKVEAAYRRGDLFKKRRKLMDDWADYLGREPAVVIPLVRRS